VSSFTVNILRTFFLKNDSGHWSEMIFLLQVSQMKARDCLIGMFLWVNYGLWAFNARFYHIFNGPSDEK